MLEFNQEHKAADLSAIKSKTEKARKNGKVMICGIVLSGVILLSGCSANPYVVTNEQPIIEQPDVTISAIIMENGNAMIADLQSYKKYTVDDQASTYLSSYEQDRTWVLYTSTGDKLLVDYGSVYFINGEDSHEKAETIAQALISENGRITCYDELQSYGMSR